KERPNAPCTCRSMRPGVTNRPPTSTVGTSGFCVISAMRPSRHTTATSVRIPSGSTNRPPTRANASDSFMQQLINRVRTIVLYGPPKRLTYRHGVTGLAGIGRHRQLQRFRRRADQQIPPDHRIRTTVRTLGGRRIVHLARAEHRIIGYGLAVRRRFLPIPETVVRRFDTAVGSVDADLESLPRTGERDRIRHARATAIPDNGGVGVLDVDLLVVQVDRIIRCVL